MFFSSLAFGSGEVIWEGVQKTKGVVLFGSKEKKIKITTEGVYFDNKFKRAEHLSKEDACFYGMSNFPNRGYFNTSPTWSKTLDKYKFDECLGIRMSKRGSYSFAKVNPLAQIVQKSENKSDNVLTRIVAGTKSLATAAGLGSKVKPEVRSNKPSEEYKTKMSDLSIRSDLEICRWAITYKVGQRKLVWRPEAYFKKYVDEAIRRGLDCLAGTQHVAERVSPSSGSESKFVPSESNFAELWQKNGGDLLSESKKSNRFKASTTYAAPPSAPKISATSTKVVGKQAVIEFALSNPESVSELLINGIGFDQPQSNFVWRGYAPIGISEILVEITDFSGASTQQSFLVERATVETKSLARLPAINPLEGPTARSTNDSLAVIVGIEGYENVADAPYAERDASLFYDVVQEKLGIKPNNIKLLLGPEASYFNLLEVTEEWIKRRNHSGNSDIYFFFAGHGRTDDSGKTAYLLPFNVRPSLIEASSLQLKSVLEGIAGTTTGKVIAFIDSCYSGSTRSGESLVAGRPLVPVKTQKIGRDNLTLFAAASNDQVAKVLDEPKHGAFSYFLLRALTGAGDLDQDGQITSVELNNYLVGMLGRSVKNQTPQLSGAPWSIKF